MDLVATAAFGVEKTVERELYRLGYESRITQPGRVMFAGDGAAICRAKRLSVAVEFQLERGGSGVRPKRINRRAPCSTIQRATERPRSPSPPLIR